MKVSQSRDSVGLGEDILGCHFCVPCAYLQDSMPICREFQILGITDSNFMQHDS